MKRILTLLAALMMLTAGASAQFRYGPILGATYDYLGFKQDLITVNPAFAYQGGLQAEVMFPGIGFGIDFGLMYNQQGAKVNFSERPIWALDGIGNQHVMIHNLMLPLHLRFKWTKMDGVEEIVAPFAFAGPDFDIQLGHSNTHGAVKFSGGDIGLTVGLGAELYRHWQVSVCHTWGMTYVLKTTLLDNFSARSRQWAVRVAYLF